MSSVYGLYATAGEAQRAVANLLNSGVPADEIQVLSSEPIPISGLRHSSEGKISVFAVAGGFIGMLTGISLTRFTQTALPLNVGGMPVVSNWTNLIVIFELTMLGVVIASVLAFLAKAGIPSRRPELYDPEISRGRILVGVVEPVDRDAVERALGTSANFPKRSTEKA